FSFMTVVYSDDKYFFDINFYRDLFCKKKFFKILAYYKKPVSFCKIISLIRLSDSLLITVAAMAVYTGYVFMPQHIMAILHYFEVVQ
uniref:Uncharacterized protein n=1 Tax=Sinocyclocheilus rhinocerous TaxID=307959 RepID=A0A673MFJ5_9TELE